MINQYEGFRIKVIQMLTRVTLIIKRATDKEVSMVDEPSRNNEDCPN
jgi:hypothetical protein